MNLKSPFYHIFFKAAFLFSLLILTGAPLVQAEIIDRVVAIVNDELITLSELDEESKELLLKAEESVTGAEREQTIQMIRKKTLEQLVNQQIITQEAKKAKIKLSDADFEAVYEQQLKRLGLTHEQLLQQLAKAGISEETYKDNIRNQALRDKLILYEVHSRIIVTEEMIVDYYNREYAATNTGKAYFLLQMGFSWDNTENGDDGAVFDDGGKAKALQKAYAVHKRADDDEDFSELARQYSDLPTAADGGRLGLLQLDDMAEYMRNAVMKLEVGEITPVIETPIGFQFFKLLSIQEGNAVNEDVLATVREEIREKLQQQEFENEYKKWVEKIKEGSHIKKML